MDWDLDRKLDWNLRSNAPRVPDLKLFVLSRVSD